MVRLWGIFYINSFVVFGEIGDLLLKDLSMDHFKGF